MHPDGISASYVTVYCLVVLITLAVYAMSWSLYVYGNIRASRFIHKQLVVSVLGTTLRYVGAILSLSMWMLTIRRSQVARHHPDLPHHRTLHCRHTIRCGLISLLYVSPHAKLTLM